MSTIDEPVRNAAEHHRPYGSGRVAWWTSRVGSFVGSAPALVSSRWRARQPRRAATGTTDPLEGQIIGRMSSRSRPDLAGTGGANRACAACPATACVRQAGAWDAGADDGRYRVEVGCR